MARYSRRRSPSPQPSTAPSSRPARRWCTASCCTRPPQSGHPGKVLQKAQEVAPDDLRARLLLGQSWESLRRYERAEEAYRTVLTAHPDHHQVRYLLAALCRRQKRHDDALVWLGAALEL